MPMRKQVYDVPVQDNGRVILPADLRRRMGIGKGDRLVIEATDESISLTTARERRRRAQDIAAKYKRSKSSSADSFLQEKRSEADRERTELDSRSRREEQRDGT